MSYPVEQGSEQTVSGLGTGLEALQQSREFRGPVEPLDGHQCNDHFAQIYESDEERFAAAVPFVRHGLDRNERVLYVVDQSSEQEVTARMRDAGIDVDAAVESGALSFHTAEETYLRNGTFDPDEIVDFYADTVATATEEYEALRVVAETTWLQDDATNVERFMEYEAKVNELFADTDSLAICQYDRNGFSPEIIREVVQTHQHLIYDGAVCHNVYYTPPEEFFGADRPAREVDRMLETLRERTEAKVTLKDRQRYLQEQNQVIADPDRPFEEKLQALFELGCERFGLELGAMARVDPENDRFEVEYVSDEHAHFEPGVELPFSETYCKTAADINAAGSVTDPPAEGYDDIYVYEELGVRAYLGTYLTVDGGSDRTFFFVSSEPRVAEFSAADRAFVRSMGQWVQYELEHRQRERFLRESYRITADPTLSFEEKLDQLLEFGCEWFDVELAGLNHLPEWNGKFRLETGVGLDVDTGDEPLWSDPGEGCFCRHTVVEDTAVSRHDVRGTDWANDPMHEELGLACYLGTKVTSGATPYGTLWFGSTEPRERQFSETERTFIELIGQWVSYEIERRQHQQAQQELYNITADTELSFEEKVDRLLDLGRDQFGLDMGFFLEKQGGEFRVVRTRGTDLEDGVATLSADPGHYCKQTVTVDVPVGVEDVAAVGWDDDPLYEEYDLGCYLGTKVTDGSDLFGSICFADSSARGYEFTDNEYTFLDLMGQWVQYELERRQYEAELEDTVGELQQSNDRLKQFAYAASHDLQEPLRMVSSYLQLLENRYGEDLDEDAQEYIDFAVDGADRMREMVDDLLAYSRVEQADGDFEQVDCDSLLDDVVDDLHVTLEETDAEISVESLPAVYGDKEQLGQLFNNLVSNAVKYNESDSPQVEITAAQRDDHWEFAVTDNGIGMDPEQTDRIFEVFKRLHHDDEYPGTGIGLSLCQEIVENHGGSVSVESTPGEGSTFFITLPQSAD